MNTTIKTIADTTTDMKVLELARTLIANKGKMFKAVFTKKDGTVRTMVFTTATNWNPLNGIETTEWGKDMVASKCAKGMATVCERVLEGDCECVHFRPRTLNLKTVISLERI